MLRAAAAVAATAHEFTLCVHVRVLRILLALSSLKFLFYVPFTGKEREENGQNFNCLREKNGNEYAAAAAVEWKFVS